jgi:hypothetical protein
LEDKEFHPSPETKQSSGLCAGAPFRLSGGLGDEVFDIKNLILFLQTLVEHVIQ